MKRDALFASGNVAPTPAVLETFVARDVARSEPPEGWVSGTPFTGRQRIDAVFVPPGQRSRCADAAWLVPDRHAKRALAVRGRRPG